MLPDDGFHISCNKVRYSPAQSKTFLSGSMLSKDGHLLIRKRESSINQKISFLSRIIFISFYMLMTSMQSRLMEPQRNIFSFIAASSQKTNMSEACLLLLSNDGRWRCMVLDDEENVRILPFSPNLPLQDSTVISGETKFSSSFAVIDWENDIIYLNQDAGSYSLYNTNQNPGASTARKLQRRSALVVRVTTNDAVVTSSGEVLSDKWFGTYGDKQTMSSRFKACSYKRLKIQPALDTSNILNGVLELKLNIDAFEKSVDQAEILTLEALQNLLGKEFLLMYDHTMIILPPGFKDSESFFSRAYVNFSLSTYNDEVATHLSAQMHSIGNNIGFGNAGILTGPKDNRAYGDTSGYMGNTYGLDDWPIMCFNAPNSWLTKWYRKGHVTVNPLKKQWTGNLFGISNYEIKSGDSSGYHIVLVKIVGNKNEDYYVSFNRSTGINRQTQLAKNRVLITRYSRGQMTTTMLQSLGNEERAVLPNFLGKGQKVYIKVIRLGNYARVKIWAS